jgi:predicted  nucleic acid-binding Zn-ribbon protein
LIDQLSRAKEETVHLCNTLKKEREQMSRSNQDSEEAQKSLEIEVAGNHKQ